MATASVQITMRGLKEFESALASLANQKGVNQRVIQKAIGPRAAGPQLALAKIKELVPVAAESYFRYEGGRRKKIRPGGLKRGIRIAALKTKRGKFQNFGSVISTPTRDELGISRDSKWYYPALLEYGWNPRRRGFLAGIKRAARKLLRLKGKSTAARSYMRRGMNDNQGAIMALIARDLRIAIEEHLDKQAARKSGRAYTPAVNR